MYMKYRMHSAGSFGCFIEINDTFRNADQMCMCVVSLMYMCIVCVCECVCVSLCVRACVCVCLCDVHMC